MREWRSLLIPLAFLGVGWGIWISLANPGHSNGAASNSANPGGSGDVTTVASTTSNAPPVPETSSGTAEMGLARHLRSIGAKMYGAYWCPHCHDQMKLFGKTAYPLLPYVECAQDGKNSQTDLCSKAGIQGFPTWIIKGQTYEGTQTLQNLAVVSGYQGPQNFKN
jgi:hypothetical protein